MINSSKITSLLIIFFLSCASVDKIDVIGRYEYKSSIATGVIQIYEDTFDYRYHASLYDVKSTGTWKILNGKLMLNSNESDLNGVLVGEELKSSEKYIQILDSAKQPYDQLKVRINGSRIVFTDPNGIIRLSEGDLPLTIIEPDLLEASEHPYTVKDTTATIIKLTVLPKDFGKIYFKEKSVKIGRNRLVFNKQIFKRKEHK